MQLRIRPWAGVVVALVAIVSIGACDRVDRSAMVASGRAQVHFVTVVANDLAPDGRCQVDTVTPFDFDVRPGDYVAWVVDNRCSTNLEFTNFIRIKPPAPAQGDPLEDVPAASSGKARIVPAGETGRIVTRVREPGPGMERAADGRYQYLIETNDRSAWFSVCEEPPCPWDP